MTIAQSRIYYRHIALFVFFMIVHLFTSKGNAYEVDLIGPGHCKVCGRAFRWGKTAKGKFVPVERISGQWTCHWELCRREGEFSSIGDIIGMRAS